MLQHILLIAVVGLALWGLVQFVFVSYTQTLPDTIEMQITEDGGILMDAAVFDALTDVMLRQQNTYLLTIGIMGVLLVIFYYAMTRLVKYFREASAAVGQLLDEGSKSIALSPEMDFMEAELNRVKAELARREQAARDAERRKNELVVYLAHDIRTPLTTVIGYLNLLQEQPEMPAEDRAAYLGVTLESAERLETLINQFFEITRFNVQAIQLDMQAFDLSMLLRQLAESFYPELEAQGKRIEITAPAHLMVEGDADKLARAFRNLMKNAATYSDAHTAIHVKAHTDDTGVTVTISDTGISIPQEELASIFDKFYRADNARSARTGGAGLGLAIAKEIVLAHGGRISADCEGNEVVFTVWLPRTLLSLRTV